MMTTKRIVYKKPDGGVAVVCPAPQFLAKKDGDGKPVFPTEDDGIAAVIAKAVPADATDVTRCELSDLPSDREFRNAWVRSGNGAVVNLAKARTIQKARIREAQLLAGRELAAREAIGDDVAAEKAALRAMNRDAAIDAAPDIEALRATWPTGLRKP